MLDVFLTVDVEVWCDGWDDIDAKFPTAYERYIHGRTPRGDYGLPFQLKVLNDHGLGAVFFVEPLFATRFGIAPLTEVVSLLQGGGQEVQLHLHTEWVDESIIPLLPPVGHKRQHLRQFDVNDQQVLIEAGRDLLAQAGATSIDAFRAGSFGFNRDTLTALARAGIAIDSSYNATLFGPDSGVQPGSPVLDIIDCDGVREYPMTVFDDGTGTWRHAQLTACSFAELEGLLWQAAEVERGSFVLLSHSFELLNRSLGRPDDLVIKRFRKLCAFLERNRDTFRVRGFAGATGELPAPPARPLSSPLWKTAGRIAEQAYRRTYQ